MSGQTATMTMMKAPPRQRDLTPYEGLTMREARFVSEYIRNGGNGTRAILSVVPTMTESLAWNTQYTILRKPQVKKVIQEFLAATCLNKEFVVSKFNQLTHDDKQESTQLNATKELGRILGLYSDEHGTGNRSGSINLTFNLPGTAREETIIDVKAKETE